MMKLELVPDWDTIKATWDPCMEHLSGEGLDPDAAYALCMVVQELLENAVKYGTFGPGRDSIRLGLTSSGDTLTVEVRTPLSPDPVQLERLDSMVQWIRGFQSPFEAYVERLKEVASRSYANGESGLGLVRVAYEGQCILDFYTDDFNVLAMSAVYQRQAGLSLGGSHGHTRDLHPEHARH
jgi:hypothetical protein